MAIKISRISSLRISISPPDSQLAQFILYGLLARKGRIVLLIEIKSRSGSELVREKINPSSQSSA